MTGRHALKALIDKLKYDLVCEHPLRAPAGWVVTFSEVVEKAAQLWAMTIDSCRR